MKPPYIILLFTHCIFTGITAIQAGLCPSGWNSAPNRRNCFLLVPNVSSWDDAEAICQNRSGHLAALTSVQELKYVQALCRNVSKGCWVGGHGVRSKKGFSWQWSDHQSHWNNSSFPRAPTFFNCPQSSCVKTNLTELCTLVMNRKVPLVGDECKNSHEFVCMLSKGNKCEPGHCHREYTIILAVVSGFILLTTFAVVIWLLVYKRNRRRRRSRKISSPSAASLVPPSWRVYTNDELRMITKNFGDGNKLLGDAMTKTGGTYGGILPDGSLVAVKKLKKSSLQSKKEFLSEIGRIARLRHDNLVAIKGCCYEHNERYIVYEFVANGPLDRWLHHLPRGGRSLDWGMRMRIATTLAQGIAFLHDKVKPHVVHRDIRASNVLLDEEYRAHLLGVGLYKFVPWEGIHERTVMAGTYGYLAPEFVYRNELTTKSDVYSFGVLLLELVSGRKPVQTIESVDWQAIFEWATPLVQSHRYTELLDPVITDIPDIGQIQKVVDLAYTCTQHVPSMRPHMSYVVHQLQQLEMKVALEAGRIAVGNSSTMSMEVEFIA
ncbi:hypothetical protein SUGI_1111880 [Cryptomeria japonica]|uniref:C-type lectin receptor-like tyrosine-protein kinase At1g52310 n=1 Tax=Cryptomeria japonica TaxID=3369 RepID=UPI002414B543|nr:C-type lectin receptor-like tyrosine-protein kinase At1g52310 [Cryptomeria japonica]GLJ52265.1 hypothetical protein SUGI_1111880 [Cryptomeria japonica]